MFQTINKLVRELHTTEDEQLYHQYCSCECCQDGHHDVSTNRLSNYSWQITVLGDHRRQNFVVFKTKQPDVLLLLRIYDNSD